MSFFLRFLLGFLMCSGLGSKEGIFPKGGIITLKWSSVLFAVKLQMTTKTRGSSSANVQ